MDQRTSVLFGSGLLIVGSIVVLLFAITPIPIVAAVVAAIIMAVGTLMVGTSANTV